MTDDIKHKCSQQTPPSGEKHLGVLEESALLTLNRLASVVQDEENTSPATINTKFEPAFKNNVIYIRAAANRSKQSRVGRGR